MTRVTRRVLQMSDRELEAVIAVAMPGRKIEGLRRDERQEICMKWLFANGLSINHQFTLDIEDDDIYVLMSNKSACACCTKDTDVVSVKHFDSGAIGTSLAIFSKLEEDGVVELQIPTKRVFVPVSDTPGSRSDSNLLQPKVHQRTKSDDNVLASNPRPTRPAQIHPIITQPKPLDHSTTKSDQAQKEEPPQDVSCWKAAYREFGLCCFSLSSLC
ncbi:hypothetical protein RB195_008203 [Necator americanus]|uniref:Uncharacterized protein n=1 Tax=Necator americanus TaxID=51031 RepID=A0ABR1CMG9_NECAM